MSAVYPTSVVTLTTKVNHVDVYDASHVNRLQEEVIALQTYIGTNPHGNKAELTTRIAQLMATNGAINQGVAFPTNPVEGQGYWRTDLTTFYIYGNSAWNAQGQSFSNYLFQYSGVIYGTGSGLGEFVGTNYRPTAQNGSLRFLQRPPSGVIGTIWTSTFKKVSGINTVTIKSLLWQDSSAAGVSAWLRVTIGTLTGTAVGSANMTFPEWNSCSINVSGLGANSFYDVVAEMVTTNNTGYAYCANITGLGS